ncbi:D-glutamate cyclase family protein [Chloroflexota bacterium]
MATFSEAETRAMSPRDFRSLVRKGEYTDTTIGVSENYTQANLAIVPKEYAFEFLLFCNRNPLHCPVLEVGEPGDPEPKQLARGADLRTDLSRYRVYREGEVADEPTDITKYWRDDLIAFLLGCSQTFVWALKAANIPFRRYGVYRTTVPSVAAGHFHGTMAVTVRAFYNAYDAVRAVQISSRHRLMHGPPIHIGDPAEIGVELGQPDPFNPHRPAVELPKPGEVVMSWGCGVTAQTAAVESKTPFMITHSPAHMFVTDRLIEELAIL